MSHPGLLDTRSRRRYVGANGDNSPLLGGKPSKSPITLSQVMYGLGIFLVVGAAVAGLITGSVALSYGKNDVNDPLTLGSLTVDLLKVTNMTDLSMSEVLPGMWMTPTTPPGSKRSKRMTVSYDVNPANQQIVLGNAGVTYNIRFPKNLNAYVSKEYHLFSNTSQPHTVVFTGPGCGGTYEDTTWDAARQKPLAKFDAEPGAYIHFKVVDCGTVTLIESRKVDFCFENMTHCEHPKRDVNADWADVKDLVVSGSIQFPECPEEIIVGSAGFPTIQSALDIYRGQVACPVRIKIPAGRYVENVVFESATAGLKVTRFSKGPVLLGDERFLAGTAFVHEGIHLISAGFSGPTGTFGAPVNVTLSGTNTLIINVAGLDLSAFGYGTTDKITIRDGSGNFHVQTITAVTADSISFDGAGITSWEKGSYVVFRPNVEIAPAENTGTLTVNNANLAIQGIAFVEATSSLSNVLVVNGVLSMANCLVEDLTYQSFTGIGSVHSAQVHFRNYVGSSIRNAVSTVVGFRIGLFESHDGSYDRGYINQFDSQGLAVSTSNEFTINALQLSHFQGGFIFRVLIAGEFKVQLIHTIQTNLLAAQFAMNGENSVFDTTDGTFTLSGPNIIPVYCFNGCQVQSQGGVIDGAFHGFLGVDGAKASISATTTFVNMLTDAYFVYDYSTDFKITGDYSNSGGHNGFFVHSESGSMFPSASYRNQKITAAEPIELTLNTQNTVFGIAFHEGQTYTVIDTTGHNHTIALTGSANATFEGCGINIDSNVLVFDGTVGAHVTFIVETVDTIRVLEKECVTFEQAVAKRDITTQMVMQPYGNVDLPAEFQNKTVEDLKNAMSVMDM